VSAQATISRREQILGAAASLFSERGYHATSMRDIGVAAGMLHGSLYAHIRTKEDLLYEIVLRAAEQFLDGAEAAAGSEQPAENRLRAAMRAHVRVVAEDVDAARVFHHEWRALSGERLQEVLGLRDRYEDLWDVIVGALPGRRPRKLTRLLVLSAANWVYTWYDPSGPLSPDQVADGFTDLLLRGLRGGREGTR
jgi:TetR/AcrR family transcriptional regulator, cholesterol catabolism regulator